VKLNLKMINMKTASKFIENYHRHHKPTQGWKFGIGVIADDTLVGVAVVGRPVARMLDDGDTLEVTRLCTNGTPHVASMLYGAAWRAGKALGCTRMITYILKEETGTSLKAAGWVRVDLAGGGTWNRPNRGRIDKHPIEQKVLWEKVK